MNEKNPFRWVMLMFIFLFYFTILGFTNQTFNILLATITEDMGWTATQRTAIAGAMSSGMIWFVFAAGTMLDRFSVKKILGSAVLLSAVLIFIRGRAENFTIWFAIMFLFGVASAFYMPACTKMIGLWFDSKELPFANGVLTAASPIGQLTANLLGVRIMYALGGWETLYTLMGTGIVLIVFFFFIIAKDRKSEDAALTSTIMENADLSFWKNIGGILKVPMVWVYCIANMFFLGSIYAGGALGQVVYQTDPRWMLDRAVSGRIPAANNMASMVAYIVVPLIIAKVGSKHYRKAAIVAGFLAPVCFMIGIRSFDIRVAFTTYALAGVLYGAIVPASKVLMLQLPEVRGQRAGTALGVYVTIERIGITAMISLLGGMIAANPDTMANSLANFFTLQFVAPILIIIGGLVERRRANTVVTATAEAKATAN
ncbi:MFS transporter [Anoxynatronum buryatiense]|uniref:MFS transporter n=1 Tax=Anoxynatronum buryatiense TaxID=489973 RepID=UPI0024B677E2|nr:MFS transporter [Anoxynatronum buryatiense]